MPVDNGIERLDENPEMVDLPLDFLDANFEFNLKPNTEEKLVKRSKVAEAYLKSNPKTKALVDLANPTVKTSYNLTHDPAATNKWTMTTVATPANPTAQKFEFEGMCNFSFIDNALILKTFMLTKFQNAAIDPRAVLNGNYLGIFECTKGTLDATNVAGKVEFSDMEVYHGDMVMFTIVNNTIQSSTKIFNAFAMTFRVNELEKSVNAKFDNLETTVLHLNDRVVLQDTILAQNGFLSKQTPNQYSNNQLGFLAIPPQYDGWNIVSTSVNFASEANKAHTLEIRKYQPNNYSTGIPVDELLVTMSVPANKKSVSELKSSLIASKDFYLYVTGGEDATTFVNGEHPASGAVLTIELQNPAGITAMSPFKGDKGDTGATGPAGTNGTGTPETPNELIETDTIKWLVQANRPLNRQLQLHVKIENLVYKRTGYNAKGENVSLNELFFNQSGGQLEVPITTFLDSPTVEFQRLPDNPVTQEKVYKAHVVGGNSTPAAATATVYAANQKGNTVVGALVKAVKTTGDITFTTVLGNKKAVIFSLSDVDAGIDSVELIFGTLADVCDPDEHLYIAFDVALPSASVSFPGKTIGKKRMPKLISFETQPVMANPVSINNARIQNDNALSQCSLIVEPTAPGDYLVYKITNALQIGGTQAGFVTFAHF